MYGSQPFQTVQCLTIPTCGRVLPPLPSFPFLAAADLVRNALLTDWALPPHRSNLCQSSEAPVLDRVPVWVKTHGARAGRSALGFWADVLGLCFGQVTGDGRPETMTRPRSININ